MMSRPRFFTSLCLAAASMSVCANAATLYWDGNVSTVNGASDNTTTSALNWLSGGNWDNGTTSAAITSWTATDGVVFGGTAGIVNLASTSGITLTSLTFLTPGYQLNFTDGAGARTYNLGTVTGNGTITVATGSGNNTVKLGTSTNWAAFTGTIKTSGGAKLMLESSGLTSAASVDVTSNGAVYAFNTTHSAGITLRGGDTGESLGQLRLDGGNWSGSVTLAGTITGSGDGFIGTSSGAIGTISGNIGEDATSRNLSKTGAGTVILTGTNTYTGGTTVVDGTLRVAGAGTLGAGTVSIASGKVLQYSSSANQSISLLTGAGSLTKDTSATSTLTFSGANSSFTGATTLAAGTLSLDYGANDASKLADAAVLTLGSGTLTLAGATGSHTEVVGSTTVNGAATITRSGANTAKINLGALTFSNGGVLNVTESGSLAITSTSTDASGLLAGVLVNGALATKDGSNYVTTYSGYTDLNRLGGAIANGATTNVRIVDGGSSGSVTVVAGTTINTLSNTATAGLVTVDIGGVANTLRLGASGMVVSAAGSAGLTISNGNLTAGGVDGAAGTVNVVNNSATATIVSAAITNNVGGIVGFSASGTGETQLTGVNTYTGTTLVGGGTLTLGGTGSLGGGTYAAAITNNGTLKISTTAAQTLSGIISGSGSLVKTGSTTLTLSNTNTYTGSTSIGTGSTLDVSGQLGGGNYSGNISNAGAFRFTNNASATQTISGAISGTGTLTKTGNSTLILSGANNYSGGTFVQGGKIIVNGASTLGAVTVNTGTTLQIGTGGNVTVGALTSGSSNGTATVQVDAGATLNASSFSAGWATSTTVNGVLAISGQIQFATNSNNPFAGSGQTTAGSMRFANSGIVGFSSTGSFTVSGSVIHGGAGTFNQSNGTVAFTSSTADAVAFGGSPNNFTYNLTGGTLNVLNSAVTMSQSGIGAGSLSISAGSANLRGIKFGSGSTTSAGTVSLSNTGTLKIGSAGITDGSTGANAININFSGGTLGSLAAWSTSLGATLTNTTAIDTTDGDIGLGGVLTSTGGIKKVGSGTLTLSGANNYTGTTAVDTGTLAVSGSGKLGASTAALTFGGGTLDLTSAAAQTVGAITVGSGNGTLAVSTNTANADAARLTGGVLTKTGNLTVDVTGTNVSGNLGLYKLVVFSSATGSGTVSLSGNPDAANYALRQTATGIDLQHKATIGLSLGSYTANVHTGNTQSLGFTVSNTAPTNSADLSYTLGGNASGTGTVAAGSSSGLSHSHTAVAGENTVTVSVADAAANNTTQSSSFTVYGYNLATGTVSSPTTINLGTVHAGGSLGTSAITVANGLASGTYNETLGASFTGTTGDATSSGSVTGLYGSNGSSMSVGINSSTAGAKSGTATVSFTSQAVNSSGLGNTSRGTQEITVTGQVYSGDMTYSGGAGTWNTHENWTDNNASGVHYAAGTDAGYTGVDKASFSGTGGTVSLDGQSANLNTLAFSGANGYTVAQGSGGALTLSGTNAAITAAGTHSITAPVTLGAATSVSVTGASDSLTINGAIDGAFALTKNGSGNLTLGSANTFNGLTVNSGKVTAGNANALGNGTVSITGGELDLGGIAVANAAISVTGGTVSGASGYTGQLNFGGAAGLNGTFAGVVDLGTDKTRAYSTTGLTVTGTLQGQGTVTGNVTVNGHLNIGNSPGTLEVAGDVVLGSSSTSTFEIGGETAGSFDVLSLSGTLTLDGTITVASYGSFNANTLTAGDSFDFIVGNIDGTGFNVANDLKFGTGMALASGLQWDTSQFASTGVLSVTTAIPEPSTYGLLGAGALALATAVRRRRRAAR